MVEMLKKCCLCPRACMVDRTAGEIGYCGGGHQVRVTRVMLHAWEEPCISGTDTERGSGAVFFAHCSLGCVYCQNRDISRRDTSLGQLMDPAALAEVFLSLQRKGAWNLDLVSPTHYAPQIAAALEIARGNGFCLPVIWNTGGYESAAVVENLAGLADVYLTDFKYADPALAGQLSGAPDYPERAAEALAAMYRNVGPVAFDEQGMIRRGVILRHLVLPGYRKDSIAVLRRAAEVVPVSQICLSLMRQYTPEFLARETDVAAPRSLYRRVTEFEYQSVLEEAVRLGYDGFTQEKSAATAAYTPDFTETQEENKEVSI